MATFQDPYANADYVATLLSGQVAGGYLEKEPTDASEGFWMATSTNLGLNFTASAINGFAYTANQSASTSARLQFSTDGSNVKAIDGSNIDVGAYEFDLLEYILISSEGAGGLLNDMWTSGMTFSAWVRPGDSISGEPTIWYKGGKFLFKLSNSCSIGDYQGWKVGFFCETDGTDWDKESVECLVKEMGWSHVVAKWSGDVGDDPVIYVNGVLATIVASAASGDKVSDEDYDLNISSERGNNNFVGGISDVIFWRSELTDTQMKEIYLYSKIPTGFVARYRLADTSNEQGEEIADDTTVNNGELAEGSSGSGSSSSSSSSSSGP